MDPKNLGRIFVLSNSMSAHGYKDFLNTIDPKLKPLTSSLFINSRTSDGIIKILEDRNFNEGDVICIVRGGGDINHESFTAYNSADAAVFLLGLIEDKGVIVITGIGHQSNEFVIETHVSQRCITPTAAGIYLNKLFEGLDIDVNIQDLIPKQQLAPEFTFDNFLASNMNAAIKSVCIVSSEQSDPEYTPIIIKGLSGYGKTHILRAVENNARIKQPTLKVMYFTTKDLIELYDVFSQKQVAALFYEFIKSLDILLIDDLDYLQGKDFAQRRIIEVIDYFSSANKTLILSINNTHDCFGVALNDHLRSCTVFTLEGLSLSDRYKMTAAYAKQSNVPITEDVINKIAGRAGINFREIKGAINTIKAHAQHMTHSGSGEDLCDVICNARYFKNKDLKFEDVVRQVCECFKVKKQDLLSKSRKAYIVVPRQVVMYLAYKHLDISYPGIGELMSRDHTTILSGVDKIKTMIKEDNGGMADKIKDIENSLLS